MMALGSFLTVMFVGRIRYGSEEECNDSGYLIESSIERSIECNGFYYR